MIFRYKATLKTKKSKNNMCCALLTPLHLKTHFAQTIPWNDAPLLFKYSPKVPILNVCEALRQTDTRCYCSYHKFCKADGRSGILMPFGIKKQTSTLAAYDIAYIFPHKKNNV